MSTCPLLFSLSSTKEIVFACPPWNPPSCSMEITLSTLFFRFNRPRSRQGAALSHLDSLPSHHLVIWADGSVFFLFGKGGSGVLSNHSVCGTKATRSFSAGPVCLSFSAEACTILQALCWSREHQQDCHFSSLMPPSDSCFGLATLSFPMSFYLTLFDISGRNCLFFPPHHQA